MCDTYDDIKEGKKRCKHMGLHGNQLYMDTLFSLWVEDSFIVDGWMYVILCGPAVHNYGSIHPSFPRLLLILLHSTPLYSTHPYLNSCTNKPGCRGVALVAAEAFNIQHSAVVV